ncbi:MAG: shikimate dehydrogenase [Desulfopila sp.]
MNANSTPIDGTTRVYGIIGNPVSHSRSPAMHNRAFAELGENRVYVPLPVTDVSAGVMGLRGLGLWGASVTIPHKEAVIPLLDYIDPVAARIGAVNTIAVVETADGRELHGSNTDWLGANRALAEHVDLPGKRVVIVGAGGSARAIGFGLQTRGAEVVLCSRTERRGRALAADLDCPWYSLDQLDQLAGDVLLHATSVGMEPNTGQSLVAIDLLARYRVVMDIVYAPLTTRLLAEAEAAGCATVNGLEMLLYQGVAQFELWTGVAAPVEVMREVLMAGRTKK